MPHPNPEFSIIHAAAVKQILKDRNMVMDAVRDAYRLHGQGKTRNPASCFLRFPHEPLNRFIALPSSLDSATSGIKWIGSFPLNTRKGLPRASALLILNEMTTGRPFACIEGAQISAARTAASAAITAKKLAATLPPDGRLGVIGAGVIAQEVVAFLVEAQYAVREVLIHDIRTQSAVQMSNTISNHSDLSARPSSLNDALECQTIITATTAVSPFISRPLASGQLVLNISLRDFQPNAVIHSQHILDDIDHCLTAGTSPFLLEQLVGDRSFVSGTIPELLDGNLQIRSDLPVVVSPFGLGVLDLAVGWAIYKIAKKQNALMPIHHFFKVNDE